MSKKVLSFLVTLSLLVSQVFCVVAEDTNGILWNYDEASGTLTVSGTGDMEDFSDSSDAPWYINKSGITAVIVEDGVTSVGDNAFSSYTALKTVHIGKDVVSIGNYAFESCRMLGKVTFGDESALQTIGRSAFEYCGGLTSFTVPENVSKINSYCFDSCYSLAEVYNKSSLDIQAGKTSNGFIAYFAQNVYKPESGASILTETEDGVYMNIDGEGCFLKASDKVNVDVASSYTDANGNTVVVKSIYSNAFYGRYDIKSVNIAQGIKDIGESAFYGCTALENIVIPSTVVKIGAKAFSLCSKLETVEFAENSELVSISTQAFFNCRNLDNVVLPEGVNEIGVMAFANASSLTNVTFNGDAPESFGVNVFNGCASDFSISYYKWQKNWSTPEWNGYPCAPLDVECTHEGGTATCHSKAICDICGEEYGEVDPENHDGETTVNGASDAVCGTPGYTGDKICLGCNGVIEQGEEIPALTHEGGMATCHSKAICDHCGEEYGEIDPANHDGETAVNGASDAVCGTPGYTGDKICLGCNGVIEQGEEIPALTHEGGTATCHSKAICDHCGEEYGEIDSKNHDGGTETKSKDADCGNNGYINGVFCLGCGHMIAVEEVLPATGLHEGGTATCHSKAICIHCEEEYGEIAPGNHDGETKIINAVSASCGVAGYTGDTVCLGCENVINYGKEIPALTHEGGTATCHSGAICIHCEKEYGEIAPENHDGATEIINTLDASCGVAGYTGDTVCLGCETVLNYGEEIPALTHEGGTATCHSKAICIHCEKEYGEIAPGNHDGATEIINTLDASCGVAGYTGDTLCHGCENVINYGKEIPALTHEGGTATCHSKAICIHCEKEYGEFNTNNHNGGTELRYASDASCGVAGYTGDTVCLGCEMVTEHGKVIPALTHEGGTATCHSKAICIHCEKEYGEIAPNNHNGEIEIIDIVEASCGVVGYTGDTFCHGCETVIFYGSQTPALVHEGGTATCHSKAICIHCEKEYGEVDLSNHDGETEIVGAEDATPEKNGYTGDVCCTGCGEVIEYGKVIYMGVSEGFTTVYKNEAVFNATIYDGELPENIKDGKAYTVYFTDETGEYISVEWLNMAYTLPYDSYSTVKVYKLGEDGTYEEADVEICNNRIVFNAFENGVYVIVTATLSGDANCDGIVNGKDVVRIKKYMENTETIIAKSADVNGDGDINEVDISLIVDMITAA